MAFVYCHSTITGEINMNVFSHSSSNYLEVRDAFDAIYTTLTDDKKQQYNSKYSQIQKTANSLVKLYKELNPIKEKLAKVEKRRFILWLAIAAVALINHFIGFSSIELFFFICVVILGFEFDTYVLNKSYQACSHTELILLKDIGVSDNLIKNYANSIIDEENGLTDNSKKWSLSIAFELINNISAEWRAVYLSD